MTRLFARSLCAIAVATSTPGYSQQDPDSERSNFAIEEVVVTARKRSESLQEVPLSVTPFSGDQMEKRGFVNLEDIANNTPGLSFAGGSTSGYQESPTIRGLKQGFVQDRTQNVATFLDGVYLQRQSMAHMGLVDMERIEVVKGPQNSLYGRNAFAGAINYVTAKPTEEFEGYVSATKGDNNREDLQIGFSGPLIEDTLLARYTYGTSEYDGHTKNKHPYAWAEPAGFNDGGGDEQLGGNDDESHNFGLIFNATDTLRFDAGYFKTKLRREGQPHYVINGVQEVAKQQSTPFSDMNFNEVKLSTLTRDVSGLEGVSIGNTMWKGRIPLNPGKGAWVGAVDSTGGLRYDWGFGPGQTGPDSRIIGAVDPRSMGFVANSDILRIGVEWDINDDWSTKYTYGWIDHDGETGGPAERNALFGSNFVDVNNAGLDDVRQDAYMQTNAFSARPNVEQEVSSHELRVDWNGSEDWSVSFGGYYSEVEDEQYDRTTFAPICTTEELLLDQDQEAALGCFLNPGLDVVDSPLVQAEKTGFYVFARDQWGGAEASKTAYEDTIASVFAVVEYHITPDITLRAEGRYTEEEKNIERKTDLWGLAAGEYAPGLGTLSPLGFTSAICEPGQTQTYDRYANPGGDASTPDGNNSGTPGNGDMVDCIAGEDSKTYNYFTPKIGIDWNVAEGHMLYAYAANGLKAGGFNNTAVQEQTTYKEETNWTYEIGSKNSFFEGVLQLNGAVYYIDWTDVQGGEAPMGDDTSPNAGVVTGNTGDVTNYGAEIDGMWAINEHFIVDFGGAYTNPKYEDGVENDAAERYFYYRCTAENLETDTNVDGTPIGGNFDDVIDKGELCGDTDVGGNELPKVSKFQYQVGLNYNSNMFDTWDFTARIDLNYQSRQWVDNLNEAYIPSRTLYNASMNWTSPEHWELSLWGKNITDKEYISGTFQLALFNKYIVSYGAGRTYGGTLKYKF